MHGYPYYGYSRYPAPPVRHHGLMGVVGGLIGLTTATLHGGARLVQTIVEGTVWHADPHLHGHGCSPCGCQAHHYYRIHCLPHDYDCCSCC